MIATEQAHESPHRRILLLSGQGFALGLTMAWILIPASAIFLEAYGSELLPVTYIGAAVAGIGSSTLLAAAFRRRPLASVAAWVLAGLAVSLLASWLVLSSFNADWVSFVLLALVPIVVPVGFIFVVGQAGMLLDVRTLKALYARVVAGFALGFVAGGLVGEPLLGILGDAAAVLAAAAGAAVVFLALVVETKRRYPAELSVVEAVEPHEERATLRTLSRNRYIMLIVGFQMLSALASQLLDFHVLASAGNRYHDTTELAQFLSRFSAIAYGTDVLFLLLLAGLLLRRFGLRYGLTANSIAVLTVLAAIIVATSVAGSGATIVFVLIVAARVIDLTFSDGSARTSISAAYQAVPTRLRSVAQAAIEGLAVPVAIGASGVVLLVVQSAGSTDGLVLPCITGTVVLAWLVVATMLFRAYRANLLANLRGRTLDPADLSIEDENSLIVIDRLLESDDERDVRLGLDILTVAEHPELATRLDSARHRRPPECPDRRARTIGRRRPRACDRGGPHEPRRSLRRRSGRQHSGAGHRPTSLGPRADRGPLRRRRVRRARGGGIRARHAWVTTPSGVRSPTRSRGSPGPRTRTTASPPRSMLDEVEPGDWLDRTTLGHLLADPDPDVVNAALDALLWPDDAELLDEVAPHLDDRHTAGAAVDALVRAGDAALAVIDDGLRGDDRSRHVQELLVRTAREIGDSAAVGVLRRYVEHRDREVGLAVLRALAALGPAGAPDDAPDPTQPVVRDDLEHAAHILRALVAFEQEPRATVQSMALRDELDLVRQRVMAAFTMRHGTEGFNRVVFQLGQRDSRSHALALEWLDVTLTGTDRAVVAMLEPRWSDRERLHALTRTFPLPAVSQHDVLLDLVEDRHDRWRRPWIKACAVYTAWSMADGRLDAITAATTANVSARGARDGERIVYETLDGIHARGASPIASCRCITGRSLLARAPRDTRRPLRLRPHPRPRSVRREALRWSRPRGCGRGARSRDGTQRALGHRAIHRERRDR